MRVVIDGAVRFFLGFFTFLVLTHLCEWFVSWRITWVWEWGDLGRFLLLMFGVLFSAPFAVFVPKSKAQTMTKPELLPYEALFREIAHGDRHHRAWLLETLRTSPTLAALTRPTPAPDVGLVIDKGLETAFRSCLRFAASHSVITAAQEKAFLTAISASGTGWRSDIENAPKDGGWITTWDGQEVQPMCWINDTDYYTGWATAGECWGAILYEGYNEVTTQPTHWQPLPTPPTGGQP